MEILVLRWGKIAGCAEIDEKGNRVLPVSLQKTSCKLRVKFYNNSEAGIN
jgi:hypothetical protein